MEKEKDILVFKVVINGQFHSDELDEIKEALLDQFNGYDVISSDISNFRSKISKTTMDVLGNAIVQLYGAEELLKDDFRFAGLVRRHTELFDDEITHYYYFKE